MQPPQGARGSAACHELIHSLYAQSPHTTLYTPYCKIRDRLGRCSFLASTDGRQLSAAIAYSVDAIEFTWAPGSRRGTLHNLLVQQIRRMGAPTFLPLLEGGRRSWIDKLQLPLRDRCFRALHNGAPPPTRDLPDGYRVVDCDPAQDLPAAVRLMNNAYRSLPGFVTVERLQEMTRGNHFYPPGWFFLAERHSGRRVGLAISGYDAEMDEGFLDWIELLPHLRGRGFGQQLVAESLRRLAHARHITVAGSIDAPFVTGGLFRRCGFTQQCQWTVLGSPRQHPAEATDSGRARDGHRPAPAARRGEDG